MGIFHFSFLNNLELWYFQLYSILCQFCLLWKSILFSYIYDSSPYNYFPGLVPKDTSLAIGVYVAAEEVGAQERTPYDSYSYNDVPNTSLQHIMR